MGQLLAARCRAFVRHYSSVSARPAPARRRLGAGLAGVFGEGLQADVTQLLRQVLFGHLNSRDQVVGGLPIPGLASILSDPKEGTSTVIQGLVPGSISPEIRSRWSAGSRQQSAGMTRLTR